MTRAIDTLLVLGLFVSGVSGNTSDTCTTKTPLPSGPTSSTTTNALLEWFGGYKGTFYDSARQTVLTGPTEQDDIAAPSSTSQRMYTVASQDIEKGAILAIIPSSIVLTGRDDDDDDPPLSEEAQIMKESAHFDCDTLYVVWDELAKGDESTFVPYLNHIQQQSRKLPSQYSQQGKELLWEILEGDDGVMLLDHPVQYQIWDYAELCDGKNRAKDSYDFKLGAQAAVWVQQFAVLNRFPHHFDSLIPLVDLYPHRNGHYTNVEIQINPNEEEENNNNDEERYATIVAIRDITKGERLHLSLNECPQCRDALAARDDIDFGTPEIFRDHGFLEDYPQLWSIPETQTSTVRFVDEDGKEQEVALEGIDIIFRLDQDPQNNGQIKVQWQLNMEDSGAFTAIEMILLYRIRTLHRIKNLEYPQTTAEESNIPQDEWDAIWKFYHIYSMALKRAVVALHDLIVANHLSYDGQRSDEFDRSVADWEDHYTNFRFEIDHIAYNDATCQSSEHTDFASYQPVERERSNYQEMFWQYREKDDDTCLHLDGMLQICSSYRPHYHEFFVHYPARYVQEVKRVIFLGSGDAMLLHEILKYPSLEKVVGLELDQTVTRKSFKHFKTQPHYDDPRVEWWYGDATKTLPLLPRDYWGSFDLLLVDLSETVVSLHVTGQHDVLDVISMLLKPNGVMLENELYLDKMSNHFDNTVHIFYGSPKVCVQVHTVSSNSVNFLKAPIYDHGVDMYLIDPVKKPEDDFKFIHDYVNKDTKANDGACKGSDGEQLEDVVEYGRKAGILMVLEAENCTTPIDESLPVLVDDVLRKLDLTPLPGPKVEKEGTFQVVMKEGYIVARLWPSYSYVGFDIHFWGAFSKMESIRDALTAALGAQTRSSYRVVVGGMHGTNTWTQDQDEIGVHFTHKKQYCTDSDRAILDEEEEAAISAALDESLALLQHSRRLTVGVVCGATDDCLTLKLLDEHSQVDRVVPFLTCPDIPDFNNGTIDFQPMYDCERDILDRMTHLHDSEGVTIDAFVMDMAAPLSMLQIFASIWEDGERRFLWLTQSTYVLAMPFTSSDTKRKRFMDLYRKLGHSGVATMGELSLMGRSGQTTLGWRVFTVNDQEAVYRLSQMEANLQKRIPNANVAIQILEGGQLHREEDLELEQRSFRPEDYDFNPNKLQRNEQRPLGRQTIFQFEKVPNAEMLTTEELGAVVTQSLRMLMTNSSNDDGIIREQHRPDQWSDVGDGVVMMSAFSSGNLVLVWDGSDHVDINLFNLDEDRKLADGFQDAFLGATHHRFTPTLRDDQPRGFGRVVNFQSDLDQDWMKILQG